MDIALKPDLERFIAEQVKAGKFASPIDVIEAALGRLQQDDFNDFAPGEMDDLLKAADAQLSRGEGHSLNDVRAHIARRSIGKP